MTTAVDVLRLRILLYGCKARIANLLGAESWAALRGSMCTQGDSDEDFHRRLHLSLSATLDARDHLPLDTIEYLCSSSVVAEAGESQAHEATLEQF